MTGDLTFLINPVMEDDNLPDFIHLHTHSMYSLLDGLSSPDKLARRTAELGMPALALTDHGVMYGVVDFYKACKSAGIKPIIGMEAYVAQRSMQDKDTSHYHLVLLAQNETGYKNLLKLATAAQLEGFYYKPRIDRAILSQHAEGLIALSGCVKGEILQQLKAGRSLEAYKTFEFYSELFPERFYLELQSHDLPEFDAAYTELASWEHKYNAKLVATNDVHYVHPGDCTAQDVLLCVQTNKLLSETNRLRMTDPTYYLRSADEMAALFPASAIRNTMAIADQCNVTLSFAPPYHLPQFETPYGTAQEYLTWLCKVGLKSRFQTVTPEIQARLDYELSIIHNMGFDDYFLIVWDLTQYAKSHDIWWNVRGSGAGSLVAYALGITCVDPLKHKLMFERFLNPDRVSMPDIDMDFPDTRREELINYTIQKYRSSCVAQIITFGTMGAKQAIRDVGRVLDLPLADIDRIAKNTEDTIKSDGSKLLTLAAQLEGTARQASIHAAGVVISDQPLTEYLPLARGTKGQTTQYPMEALDSLGMLKIDFLGLRTLTQMRLCCELIERRHGVKYDLTNIPYETDVKLYELLSAGDTTGVFQVESAGLRKVLQQMRPSEFRHIVAAVALYRPGPMEQIPTYIKRLHGEESIDYYHENLHSILEDTYAVMIFQEQIMQIVMTMAGYRASEADSVRKAVSKKKREELEKHKAKFTNGALQNGYAQTLIERVWGDIEYFARYGFNKAHATDYAVITCQTAFLKAHYPLEFMAALLTTERGNQERLGELLTECQQQGRVILLPDANKSQFDFSLEGDKIRIGLGAIKTIGDDVAARIVTVQPFNDLADFTSRCKLSKKQLEVLIQVGALNTLGERGDLLASLDELAKGATVQKQASLFDMTTQITLRKGKVTAAQVSQWEKELLGAYISEHPMLSIERKYAGSITGAVSTLSPGPASTVGIVEAVKKITTKKGEPMAFVTLAGSQGLLDVVLFPRVYESVKAILENGKIVLVGGKIEVRDGKLQMIAEWMKNG